MIKIAPYVKITSSDGKVLQDRITDFDYLYSEDEDDVCELKLESDNPKLADESAFAEGKSLTVTWGYLDSPTLVNTRKVYIFDTRCEYTEQGIRLTLICHEKFAITKTDTAKNKNIQGNSDNQNITKILLSNEVLDNLDITDENQLSVYKMLDASAKGKNSSMDPRQKALISESKNSYAKANNAVDEFDKSKNIPNANLDSADAPRLSKTDEGLLVTLFNGSTSTYRTLKDFFDKQPGGPYVIDSRDDTVTIRTRNFASEPIREYIYKGEDGELLTFTPETKNRSKAKTSESIQVVSWDSSGKEAISQKSKKSESKDPTPVQAIWNASPVPFSPEWIQERQYETKMRLIGPEAQKIGIKAWKTYDPSTEEDKGSQRYNRYETNDGRLIYSESLVTNVGVNRVGPFGVRDGTATTLPDYIRYREKQPEQGPAKAIVRGSDSPGNARAFADNRRTNDELDTNPASAKVVGNPLLESGKQVKISNVATKHAGKYYIKSVRHTINQQGYITQIETMVKGIGVNNGSSKKNVKSSKPNQDKLDKGFSVYDRIKNEYGGIDTVNEIYKAQQKGDAISIQEQYNTTKKIKTIKN